MTGIEPGAPDAESIAAIQGAIGEGRSPRSLVAPLWERARALEATLHAFAHLPDHAPEASATGPLAGVAVGVKDLIDTADMPTCCGSPIFEGRRPKSDAEIVARLRALGATMLGKTVTTEFAWRHAGPTRNPWNLEHTPGGSSSGSAAAVAAGIVTLAIGTQTFGSVIRPAAFCGVVGFKPSFGALPREGVHELSPSLDHVGLFARRVADIAAAYPMLAGDEGAGLAGAAPRLAALALWGEPAEADQEAAFDRTRRRLAEAGLAIETVELPGIAERLQKTAETLVAYEAARSLGELQRQHPDKMSAVLTELVETGRKTSEAAYEDAVGAQAELRREAADRLSGVDAVLTLPAPGGAPQGLEFTGDARFCTPWTALGLPAITLPLELSRTGLPLGVQLVGRFGEDAALIEAASTVEDVIGVFGRPDVARD